MASTGKRSAKKRVRAHTKNKSRLAVFSRNERLTRLPRMDHVCQGDKIIIALSLRFALA